MKYYLRHRPARGWTQKKKTRSELEAQIVIRWISDGASDRQIIDLADAYLPKHIEEKAKRGSDWIQRTINNMRSWAYENGGVVSSPEGGKPRKREAMYRHTSGDVLEAALALVEDQKHADWIGQLVSCGMSRATAYRNSTRLQELKLISRIGVRVVREGRS